MFGYPYVPGFLIHQKLEVLGSLLMFPLEKTPVTGPLMPPHGP